MEFESHLESAKEEGLINDQNKNEWHQILFNDDYYIIGYYNAKQWLLKHDIDVFDALQVINEYQAEMGFEIGYKIEDLQLVFKQIKNNYETLDMKIKNLIKERYE